MPSNATMIKRLIGALNRNGQRVLYTTSQFWSEEANRPVTVYHIKRAVWDDEKEKFYNIDLYRNTSQIQIVLFLRDMWYTVNGKELPQNNELWNEIKQNYSQKGDY